jgi:acetyl esterase
MRNFLKLMGRLPGILLAKRRLLHDSEAVWEQRVGHRALALDGRRLHPRAQGYMDFARSLRLPRARWSVSTMRASYETGTKIFGGAVRKDIRWTDEIVTLPSHALTLRRYHPQTINPDAPAVLFFHGGGFVIGSLQTHDRFCRNLAAEMGAQVLSADYRLAPEHRLPAAINDAEEVWDWLQGQTQQPGFDPRRIVVCGDSAGAALSMAVCEHANRAPEDIVPENITPAGCQPVGVVLIYPPLGIGCETPSRRSMAEAEIVLNGELIDWFEEHAVDTSAEALPDASTLTLDAFPPMLVITCGFDPLRDEGAEIVAAAEATGASPQHKEYPHLFHGFITMAGLFPEADAVVQDVVKFAADCEPAAG